MRSIASDIPSEMDSKQDPPTNAEMKQDGQQRAPSAPTAGPSEEAKQEGASPQGSSISKELRDFYAQQNVHIGSGGPANQGGSSMATQPLRFVRFNPRFDEIETLKLLQAELEEQPHDSQSNAAAKAQVERVEWLDAICGFYALPGQFPMSQSQCFRSGRIYGMDVSSGAAVAALLFDQYDSEEDTGSNGEDAGITSDNNEGDGSGLEEERILDMCCCPGLKLCFMADIVQQRRRQPQSQPRNQTIDSATNTTIVGVDISENRMALCKRIINKYLIDPSTSGQAEEQQQQQQQQQQSPQANPSQEAGTTSERPPKQPRFPHSPIPKIRLYCQDGTTFGTSTHTPPNSLIFDASIARDEFKHRGKRKRMNKSARARERKRLKQAADDDFTPLGTSSNVNMKLFDKVLVDAECSTDGSWKHLEQKLKAANNMTSDPVHNSLLTNPAQLSELVKLQKKLIWSGYRLLKEGGTMVYSTCSLSQDQNEHVVSWLLQQETVSARIVPVRFDKARNSKLVGEGSLPGTVRFQPSLGDTKEHFGGGFFLAKIRKIKTG